MLLGRPIKIEVPQERKKTGRNAAQVNAKVPEHPPGCKTVFLGRCPYEIDDDAVYKLFEKCGEIAEIRWVMDKTTGEFKSCGFVDFTTEEAAKKAIVLDGTTLMGRKLRIDYAPDTKSRQRQQGQRN
jgi:nucleolin